MFAHKNGGKHVDYDDYKFQCKVCYKRFPLRQGLERHMKKHSGQGRRSTRRALENVNTSFADPSYLDKTNNMCAVAPPPLPHGFEATGKRQPSNKAHRELRSENTCRYTRGREPDLLLRFLLLSPTENLPELPDVSGIDFPIDGYAMKPKTLLDSMNTLFPEHAYPSSGHTDHLLPDQQTMYSTVASTTQHHAELTAQPTFNVTSHPADFSNGNTLHNSVVPQEMGQFNVYDFGHGVAPEVFAEQQLLDNPEIHLEDPCIPNDVGACAAPPSNMQETQPANHDMMFPLHDAVLAYLTRECEDFLSTEDVLGTMDEHPNFTPCHERPSSGLPSISAMELSPSDFTFLNGEAPLR
jgi:hypothetical protein